MTFHPIQKKIGPWWYKALCLLSVPESSSSSAPPASRGIFLKLKNCLIFPNRNTAEDTDFFIRKAGRGVCLHTVTYVVLAGGRTLSFDRPLIHWELNQALNVYCCWKVGYGWTVLLSWCHGSLSITRKYAPFIKLLLKPWQLDRLGR